MNKIASHCFEHLAVCLSLGDLDEMKEIHLEEIKDFFIKILDRKVNRDFLDNCIHGKDSNYELSTEISNTLVYAYDDYYDDIYDEYGDTEITIRPESAFQMKNKIIRPSNEKVEEVTGIMNILEEKMERNCASIFHQIHNILLLTLSIFVLAWII